MTPGYFAALDAAVSNGYILLPPPPSFPGNGIDEALN